MRVRTLISAAVIAAVCVFPIQAAEQPVTSTPAENEESRAVDTRLSPAATNDAPAPVALSQLRRMAHYEALLAKVNRSIRVNPGSLAAYGTKASILLQMDRQADAAGVAEEVIETHPQVAEAYAIASRIYAMLDLRDKAISMIDREIDLSQGKVDAEALVMRSAMRDPEDYASREQDISAVLAVLPNHLGALYGKGALEYDQGAFGAAATTYEKIRKLDGDKPATLNLLGFALYRAGNTQRADAVFQKARRRARDANTLASLCWGKVTFNIALERAMDECEAALMSSPDDPSILDSRAMIELRTGKLDLAKADFDRALAQSPEQANSLFGRALVRAKEGDIVGAQEDARAARRLWPNVDQTFRRWSFDIPTNLGS